MAGNANSGRRAEKPFRDALRMEIAEAGDSSKALRNIAKKLIEQAEAGDMQAIKEFADRIDGKVPQAVVGDNDADPINHNVTVDAERFVRMVTSLADRGANSAS